MLKKSTPFSDLTIGIQEAAEFLGFKNTESLARKVRAGQIPGAKPGREWVFYKEDLIKYIRDRYKQHKEPSSCQSIKRKTAPTITPVSRSMVLECKSLREQLRKQKHSAMKKNDVLRSESK